MPYNSCIFKKIMQSNGVRAHLYCNSLTAVTGVRIPYGTPWFSIGWQAEEMHRITRCVLSFLRLKCWPMRWVFDWLQSPDMGRRGA